MKLAKPKLKHIAWKAKILNKPVCIYRLLGLDSYVCLCQNTTGSILMIDLSKIRRVYMKLAKPKLKHIA